MNQVTLRDQVIFKIYSWYRNIPFTINDIQVMFHDTFKQRISGVLLSLKKKDFLKLDSKSGKLLIYTATTKLLNFIENEPIEDKEEAPLKKQIFVTESDLADLEDDSSEPEPMSKQAKIFSDSYTNSSDTSEYSSDNQLSRGENDDYKNDFESSPIVVPKHGPGFLKPSTLNQIFTDKDELNEYSGNEYQGDERFDAKLAEISEVMGEKIKILKTDEANLRNDPGKLSHPTLKKNDVSEYYSYYSDETTREEEQPLNILDDTSSDGDDFGQMISPDQLGFIDQEEIFPDSRQTTEGEENYSVIFPLDAQFSMTNFNETNDTETRSRKKSLNSFKK